MTRTIWLLPAIVWLVGAVPASGADSTPSAYQLLKKIPVGGEGGWDYLNIDGPARRFYITRGTRVMVVDLETDKVIGEVANTSGVHGVALATDLGRGFTSNGRDASVTIFDLKTLKEIQRVKVGNGPDAIVFDPASARVFTMNGRGNDSTGIDAATGQVVGTVKLGGRPEFAAADGKGRIYVNLEDKDEVVAFDTKECAEKGRWSIAPGKEPSGLAMDRENRRVFVTCHNKKMIVLDADSGKVVADLPIGEGTDACIFDPDNRLAFSSNGDGTLTMVHEESPDKFTVVGNVPTERGARTMALDSKTHQVYLVTAKVKPAPAAAEGQRRRREFVPGSFVVLVVGPR
jgi:DNA-binding beta-propeller fold protein YncE